MIVFTATATAAPITVTGGFVGYTGFGFCPGLGITAQLNGSTLVPTNCGVSQAIGDVSVTFAEQSTVNFWTEDVFSGVQRVNALQFTPPGVQEIAAIGDEILLGTLKYTNGTWLADPSGNGGEFHLEMRTSSPDPAFEGHTLIDRVRLLITSPTTTPEGNADFVYLTTYTLLGSLRVYEYFDSPIGTNEGSADIKGRIGSIIPTAFVNPQGAAFIDPGIALAPTVPEPATLSLLAAAALMYARRRKSRSAA
jgi:hypothetical protein